MSSRPHDESATPADPATPTAPADLPRLRRLLGTPETAWLLDRVRRRLERGQPLTGAVSLAGADDTQRTAVQRLLGRAPRPGGSLSVRLDALDAMLRRSGASPDGLAAAYTTLAGPVTPLAERRDAHEEAWRHGLAPLRNLAHDRPELADWARKLTADGLVRRLARTADAARPLLTDLATALTALPADPVTSLPAFAARVLGSAHALDDGTALATVTLSGVRALTGFPDGQGAEWRREAWASAGLLRDELSSTVLALGLTGTAALTPLADAGEPAVLTLRQLTRGPLPSAPALVRVCENPAVLAAAADTCGADCPPLVCLQGQPSAAALTLLRHLHAHGTRLAYHGDFDWGGLRIGAALLRRVPWHPWRYTAADYRAAAARLTAPTPLAGTPTGAPWDLDLAPAMADLNVRVEEETVLDTLIDDLAGADARG